MKEERFRNIRHAEYEILTLILSDERMREVIHGRLRMGVPRKDEVARGRANKAMENLSRIFRGMKENRVKNLPDWHIDSEANQ